MTKSLASKTLPSTVCSSTQFLHKFCIDVNDIEVLTHWYDRNTASVELVNVDFVGCCWSSNVDHVWKFTRSGLNIRADHSPDNVKFPDGSRHHAHVKCYPHHACYVLQNTCMDANMQLTINSFRQLFPDKIFALTFPWLLVFFFSYACHLP